VGGGGLCALGEGFDCGWVGGWVGGEERTLCVPPTQQGAGEGEQGREWVGDAQQGGNTMGGY
jgi:hypothetical protein